VQGLWEYPWVAAALLDVPFALGATTGPGYAAAWICAMVVVDAAFAWALWRSGNRRGFYLWILVLPALGPLMLASFDLSPAVLTGVALLSLTAARPGIAGALVSLAASIKLWPAAALPGLLLAGGRRERTVLLRAALLTGVALAAATIAVAGPLRLVSPMIWQERRGLQIEAIAALPLLWARAFEPAAWSVRITEFNCYEIGGPGVQLAMDLAAAALVTGLAALAVLCWRLFRAPPAARGPQTAAALVALTVLILVCTNKVFSPQYLVWLAGPLAAMDSRLSRKDLRIFIAACALTQLVFPLGYGSLVAAAAWPLVALTMRDVLLLWLGARLARSLWRE
jgi:hypothetical protein